ncbi:MAG: hypothetical protein U0359_14490 [Byssovorax sp.]
MMAKDLARQERARLGKHHGYPFLERVEAAGRTAAFAHGSAGVALLPDPVRDQGFSAIDALAAYLRSLWPDGGVGQSLDGPRVQRYVELLGLGSIIDRLRPRIQAHDVAGLIDTFAAHLKRNPMLVVLAAEMAELEATAGPGARIFPFRDEPAAQEELRDAVVYSALLGAIGLECLLAPKPATGEERADLVQARLVDILEEKRNGVDWRSVCDLFEALKMELVVRPMKKRLLSKQGIDDKSFDDKPGDGLLLQLNVLDAMYGETHLGNDDNAACGFEMMCQTSDKAPEPLLGEALNDEWTWNGQKMGVARMHIAFNEAWISLYSSWNGCFCSNYGDLMYAKLYNPGVAGAYLDIDDTIYFFPRVATLYVHLHMVVFSRLETGRRAVRAYDWEDPALRAVWGRINRTAGEAYQKRVEDALRGDTRKHLDYEASRAARRTAWSALRTAIKGAATLEGGGHEVAGLLHRFAGGGG